MAGAFWGAVRLSAAVVALAVGVAAARWAGPPAAALLAAGDTPSPWLTAAGVALVAVAAGGLVLLAGRGVRQGLKKVRLRWVDRLLGALATAAISLALSAVLLALAGESGYRPATPWAQRLQHAGSALLVLPQEPAEEAPSRGRAALSATQQQPYRQRDAQ